MNTTETAIQSLPEGEGEYKTLALIESAKQALAEARSVKDVKDIRDRAEALRVYSQQAKYSLTIQNDIAEIKLRAERRVGELLTEQDKNEGGRPTENPLHTERSFPPKLSDLGISHAQSHRWQKIASMPDDDFEQHITTVKASGEELTTASVFRAIDRIQRTEQRQTEVTLRNAPVALPDDRFRCIVIDPPWPMQKISREARPLQASTLDYPTMTLDEIEALPVDRLTDGEGCHLYLWVTQKYLPVGIELMEVWGFKYQCLMTWVKPTGITPYSWMYNAEHVIFARRGNLKLNQFGLKLAFDAPVIGHSVKPDIFYERVTAASPGPRLDMFARRPREGFVVWGNEVPHVA